MARKASKKTLRQKTTRKSVVDTWLQRETEHKRKSLENASRHFDNDDSLTVNLLESIYGQESSFGEDRRSRGIPCAAGDFQLEKKTAKRMGLDVSKENDQRFDVDDAAAASAKYLKSLDDTFQSSTKLGNKLSTIPVTDSDERVNFVVAAYNAGEGRIARAQRKATADGKDPTKWSDVKAFLRAAGATTTKVSEITKYVDDVMANAKEFAAKSKADKDVKFRPPLKVERSSGGGHWITKDGRHILID